MPTRAELEHYLKELFHPELYEDYGPNGLQVEGRDDIKKIAFALSATRESLEHAKSYQADALIVHHGLFWRFHGVRPLTGPFGARVMGLARAHINLFAYHLPLDGHPEVGNAVALARQLGLSQLAPFGGQKNAPTGSSGTFGHSIEVSALAELLEKKCGRQVLVSTPDPKAQVKTVGIITGGADNDWPLALRAGLDAYITGEMSEHHWHEAKEAGISMFAAGHHATEKFGIQALMAKVQKDWACECRYFDSENPA